MRRAYIPLALFLIAFAGYTGITRMTFRMPQTVSEGEVCSFTAGEFTDPSHLRYSVDEAWWIGFTRKQEYLSSFSVGLAIAFISFALMKVRQIGKTAAAGGMAGGGLVIGLTLSLTCLAPVLGAVGVGLFANFGLAIVAFPKWLVALNTIVLTAYGFMYVSRKATRCPISTRRSSTKTTCGEMAQ